MKRDFEFNITNEDLNKYIKDTKEGMECMEKENESIFGDDNLYNEAHSFNQLEDYEKNILCIYTYCGSYKKMEEYLNIKKSTIATTVTNIKNKMKKLSLG